MTGASPEPSHVLVVDDDGRIRELLRRFLTKHGYLVTAARDAGHASRLLDTLVFDILVIDVMMPGEDGVTFCRRVRASTGTPVLLLTARGGAEDRIAGLEAGADDYLAKPFEPRELILRIAAILRRAAPEPAEAPAARSISFGACRFDIGRGELLADGEPVRLTSTEQALMRVFARQPGETVSRQRLAEELGRTSQDEVQERAVDVQITRLRRKIEADPRQPRFLQTVRGEGYVLAID